MDALQFYSYIRAVSTLFKILLGSALLLALALSISATYFPNYSLSMVAMFSRWFAIFLLSYLAYQRKKLSGWIFFAMVAGCEVGNDFPAIAVHLQVVSKIFIRLIKCIIAPLLFGTLVMGIAGHSDIKQVGRMGWKSLLYFEIVTTIALFIGLFIGNFFEPGKGIDPSVWESGAKEKFAAPMGWEETVLHIFPENIAKSIADGNILQVVIFSVLFGVAMVFVKEKFRNNMLEFCESLSETMFAFTNIVMKLAPFAVGCALAASIGKMGFGIVYNLGKMVGSLYIALAILVLLVFWPVARLIKLPIKRFWNHISEAVSLAFATTSSESALPKAMNALEKFGIPRKFVTFVLPTGYSFNLDGTTLYLSLATLFCAQAAGIELTIGNQILMVFTLMLTSKGVAGVPRASLMILAATLGTFGIPLEPVYIIFGIDGLMDMGRTATNVAGNCLATAVVTKWEGEDNWGANGEQLDSEQGQT